MIIGFTEISPLLCNPRFSLLGGFGLRSPKIYAGICNAVGKGVHAASADSKV